jgi:dTDP-4-dehydrorhamnose 3,5-epimerase
MNITVTKTPVLGLSVIQPKSFKDFRGEYTEVFNYYEISKMCGYDGPDFVQDDAIMSTKGVLRGYHGDDRTWKYIMCLQGAFQITVVDIDPRSEAFLEHDTLILDDRERKCLLLPPKYVNAHQCLTDTCLFFYKQTTYYLGEQNQYSIRWDTVDGVYWGLPPILSERDKVRAKHVAQYIKKDRLISPSEGNL